MSVGTLSPCSVGDTTFSMTLAIPQAPESLLNIRVQADFITSPVIYIARGIWSFTFNRSGGSYSGPHSFTPTDLVFRWAVTANTAVSGGSPYGAGGMWPCDSLSDTDSADFETGSDTVGDEAVAGNGKACHHTFMFDTGGCTRCLPVQLTLAIEAATELAFACGNPFSVTVAGTHIG